MRVATAHVSSDSITELPISFIKDIKCSRVPAPLAEEYGLFPEDVGSEDEIRDAGRRYHENVKTFIGCKSLGVAIYADFGDRLDVGGTGWRMA